MLSAASIYADSNVGMTKKDVPDCLWPSNNDYGIPVLRTDLMANALDLPVCMWGTRRRTARMHGTWGFYVDDYRFSKLWKDPTPVVNSGCINIIEPNFTVHDQLPRAMALYHTYRKRWLARFWQECGIRVWVDMNTGPMYYEDNLIGVPEGWLAWATRGYTKHIDMLDHQFALAADRAGTEQILFLVYGGGRLIREKCRDRGWLWITEQQDGAMGNKVAEGSLGLEETLIATKNYE